VGRKITTQSINQSVCILTVVFHVNLD